MPKYLITHDITITRQVPLESTEPPTATLHVKVHGVVLAESEEAARENVVQYKYPGFRTEIESVRELPEQVSSKDLLSWLDHQKAIVEDSF